MGKNIVPVKSVVYALSPFQQKIMPGLWKDLPTKIHHKVSENWISALLLVVPVVGTYSYAMHFVEQEKLHHRYWAHARIDWIIFEFVVVNFVQLVNNVTLVKLALALWLKYLSFGCFNYGFKWYFSLFCMLQKIIYVLLIMLWWVPKWIYMLNFGLVFWFM